MEIMFMVFMAVVTAMALFAIMVVFRDIVNEVLLSRKERESANREVLQQVELIVARAQAQTQAEKAAEPVAVVAEPVVEEAPAPVVAEPVVEETAEEAVAEPVAEEVAEPVAAEEPVEAVAEEAPVEEAVEDEDKISFSAGQRQTLEEKYLALSSEARGWYDEIIKHATMVEGSKRFKNARYEEYKVGQNRLVRMLIKRGVIHCEFILHNSDFKNYINENKISVKQSATTMRVDSEATVAAVKNSIDIVVVAIAEEKEYKKKLAREKRKAAKAEAAAEANTAE